MKKSKKTNKWPKAISEEDEQKQINEEKNIEFAIVLGWVILLPIEIVLIFAAPEEHPQIRLPAIISNIRPKYLIIAFNTICPIIIYLLFKFIISLIKDLINRLKVKLNK